MTFGTEGQFLNFSNGNICCNAFEWLEFNRNFQYGWIENPQFASFKIRDLELDNSSKLTAPLLHETDVFIVHNTLDILQDMVCTIYEALQKYSGGVFLKQQQKVFTITYWKHNNFQKSE